MTPPTPSDSSSSPQWAVDFAWLELRHKLKDRFGRSTLPDLNAVLFLIGIQELGHWKARWTKEEKQDLMHIAACRLLSIQGYYRFVGRDEDGWPHFEQERPFHTSGVKEQGELLKQLSIQYFNNWARESGGWDEE